MRASFILQHISILTAITVILHFVACGDGSDNSAAVVVPPSAEVLSNLDKYYIGISYQGSEIPRANLENQILYNELGLESEPYGEVMLYAGKSFVSGKLSTFGGPEDYAISPTGKGAITGEVVFELNNPVDPTEAQLVERPEDFYYAAMRFDYYPNSIGFWSQTRLLLVNPRNGKMIVVRPVDWGPHVYTERVIDLSPQSLVDLDVVTDDEIYIGFAQDFTPLGRLDN